MKIVQLYLDFTQEPRSEKRHRRETPSQVLTIARRHGVSLTHATAICRANGIGGKGGI